MSEKTIIHIIFNLGRGGAETMLVQDVTKLEEYRHIIVTLQQDNDFVNDLKNINVICLKASSFFLMPKAIFHFKKIIKKYRPSLIHSHLILPNFIARFSVPRNIPLLTTIHNTLQHDFDYRKWYIRVLDRFTYAIRKSIIVGVSKSALQQYLKFIRKEPLKSYVLYTFVDEKKFEPRIFERSEKKFTKAVCVGALRAQKNYKFLLDQAKEMAANGVELDIFGDGPLRSEFQKQIDQKNLPIKLKGQVKKVEMELPKYDLYFSASFFEGFSLAVLEAMAAKVPLLLSDIDSFKEQCADTALYFNPEKGDDFQFKLNLLLQNKSLREELADKAYERVINNFTLSIHLKKLREIYPETLKAVDHELA